MSNTDSTYSWMKNNLLADVPDLEERVRVIRGFYEQARSIRVARASRGWTQARLAREAGVSIEQVRWAEDADYRVTETAVVKVRAALALI